jgi:hypothetical protein
VIANGPGCAYVWREGIHHETYNDSCSNRICSLEHGRPGATRNNLWDIRISCWDSDRSVSRVVHLAVGGHHKCSPHLEQHWAEHSRSRRADNRYCTVQLRGSQVIPSPLGAMLALPGAVRAKRTSKEPQPGMTSCLIRRMADMLHDSADRTGREGARDWGRSFARQQCFPLRRSL